MVHGKHPIKKWGWWFSHRWGLQSCSGLRGSWFGLVVLNYSHGFLHIPGGASRLRCVHHPTSTPWSQNSCDSQAIGAEMDEQLLPLAMFDYNTTILPLLHSFDLKTLIFHPPWSWYLDMILFFVYESFTLALRSVSLPSDATKYGCGDSFNQPFESIFSCYDFQQTFMNFMFIIFLGVALFFILP